MVERLHAAIQYCLIILLLAPGLSAAAPADAQRNKMALLIGNANYQNISPLANPVNDATDMAARLRALGFKVSLLKDAGQRAMEQAIRRFTRDLYQPDAVGLFFFAGHGLELDGRNYLIPVDAEIKMEADVKYETVDAGRVLDGMKAAGNGLNLVILDACRNNPYRSFFRSGGQGLAPMHPAAGSLVLYATEPGKQALDGEGRNGVFTKHLLEALQTKGLKVEDVFKKTAAAVRKATGADQTPWWEGVIIGNFYFVQGPLSVQTAPATTPAVATPVPPPPLLGHLQVNVNAPATALFINGEAVGEASPGQPLNLVNRPPGEVTVSARAEGFAETRKQVSVAPGTWTQIVLSLPKQAPASVMAPPAPVASPTPALGRLTVQVEPPDARVRILNIRPAYQPAMPLRAGRYHIEASREGFDRQRRWIVHAEDDQVISLRLQPSTTPRRPTDTASAASSRAPLRPGRYDVVEASGFDEPVLSGTLTLSKGSAPKRGWLVFEMLGISGYYRYGCQVRWDGRQLHGRVVETNDSENRGLEFTANLQRRGDLVVWVDNAGRRLLLRPGTEAADNLPFH